MEIDKLKILFLVMIILILSCNLPNKPEDDGILVLSPNGGEVYPAYTLVDIEWSTTGGVSDIVSLYYSTDSGNVWLDIGLDRNDGSFSWYVPNTASEKCFIKISDYVDNNIIDTNDQPFSITSPPGVGSIQVNYPNGGETLTAGSITTILWSSSQPESTVVSFYFSVNDGITWTMTGLDENDGSFLWYVPDYNSSRCLIKVQDYSNQSIMDISDSVFTIEGGTTTGSIEIIYPNGGQIFSNGTMETLIWTSSGEVSNLVTITFSTDDGNNWEYIALDENDGSFSWYIPDQPSTQCLLKISDYSDSTIFDVSDQIFTITGSNASPGLEVTYPVGGEIFTPESYETITWTKSGDVSEIVSLFFSIDNGNNWSEIGLDNNDGEYTWYVPNVASNTCLIKVQDYADDSIFGISKNAFSISTGGSVGSILLSYPNGGETFLSGDSETLLWSYNSDVNTIVGIEFSSDNGVNWNSLGLTPNNGTYLWVVPDIASSVCLIKVSDYSNSNIYDESDGIFSIELSGSVVSDSIYYDAFGNQNVNSSSVGFGVPGEMYARMKFTPTNNFELTHIRAFYRTENSSETVILFVLSVSTGSILQSVIFDGSDYHSVEGAFFLLSLNPSLTFFAGEEFYVVLSFLGVNYPMLATGTGINGHANRSEYSDDSINWFPLDDALMDGGEDAWVMRALSFPESRSLKKSRKAPDFTGSGKTIISLPKVRKPNRLPLREVQAFRYE